MNNYTMNNNSYFEQGDIRVLKTMISNTERVTDTEYFQYCCLDDFLDYIGYGFSVHYETRHIVGRVSSTKGLFMSLKDAVLLYNNCNYITHEVVENCYFYNITTSMLESYANMKPIDKVKLRREKGSIKAAHHLVEFIE